jgi:sugar/nucleoside kinase (ribokinase family)
LGARCAYAGILGEDGLSEWVLAHLRQEQIDVRHVRRLADARPIHSVIVIDEQKETRNIFYSLQGVPGAQPDWPAADVIRSARVLYVDHIGVAGMLRAARLAREAGIPVVADFEGSQDRQFTDLLAAVDHLILSAEFAAAISGRGEPAAAVRELWHAGRQAVIVTCGAAGCWYLGADQPCGVQHQAAYSVEVVDTTGCGDVFHGAYAGELARGTPLPQRVRFAAAAAALKATRPGGQLGIPTRSQVETFLEGQAS